MLHNLSSSTLTFASTYQSNVIYACGQHGPGQHSYYADDGFGNFLPIDTMLYVVSIDFESNKNGVEIH